MYSVHCTLYNILWLFLCAKHNMYCITWLITLKFTWNWLNEIYLLCVFCVYMWCVCVYVCYVFVCVCMDIRIYVICMLCVCYVYVVYTLCVRRVYVVCTSYVRNNNERQRSWLILQIWITIRVNFTRKFVVMWGHSV